MRKLIKSILLAAGAVLCAGTVWAAYPASMEYGNGAPVEGELLEGELFGTPSYSGGTHDTYDKAWDGDLYSYFDPQSAATVSCYTGVELDGPYVVTEIRILPREGWLDRFEGATIQGSNDGEEWETIWESKRQASEWKYYCYSGDAIDCPDEGYTMFRYVNLRTHGDVGEIELYGRPAVDEEAERLAMESAAESEELQALLVEREEIAKHVMTAPSSSDPMMIFVVLIVVSGVTLVGMTVASAIMRKKKNNQK